MQRFKSRNLIIIVLLITAIKIILFPEISLGGEIRQLNFAASKALPNTVDDVVYYLFKQLGYEVNIIVYGNNTGINKVNSGEMDGYSAGPYKTYESSLNIETIPTPVVGLQFIAYKRESYELRLNGWEGLKEQRVGHTYQKPYAELMLEDKAMVVKQYRSQTELFEGLTNHEIDVAIITQIEGQDLLEKSGIKAAGLIEEVPIYISMNKKHENLVMQANEVLQEMHDQGIISKLLFSQSPDVLDSGEQSILLIFSNNADSIWDNGIEKGLDKQGETLNSFKRYTAYLDSSQNFDRELKMQSVQKLIRADYVGKVPSLIVATDNAACNFIVEQYNYLFQRAPVVLCGINDYQISLLDGLGDHIAVVKENVSANETLDMALKLFPQTRNVYVINDHSDSGKAWRNDIQVQLAPYEASLEIEYSDNVPIAQILQKLKSLPANTVVLCGEYYTDQSGRYHSESESQKLFYENSNAPIFGLQKTTFGYGQIGGKYVDPVIQGELAAAVIDEILQGKKPKEIGILSDDGKNNQWIFDAAIMSRWFINESSITKHVPAEFINKKLNLYESNPLQFILMVIFFAIISIAIAISIVLLTNVQKRNRKMKQLQAQLFSAEALLAKDDEIKILKENSERIIHTAPIGYALVVGSEVCEINIFLNKLAGVGIGSDIREHKMFAKLFRDDVPDIKYYKTESDERRFYTTVTSIKYKEQDAKILWCMDVEENESQQDMLVEYESELNALMENLPVALAISSIVDKKLRYVNLMFQQMLKAETREELIGRERKTFTVKTHLSTGLPSDEVLEAHIRKAVETKNVCVREEWQYINADSDIMDCVVNDVVTTYKNEDVVMTIIKDVSNEKRYFSMLKKAAEKEKEANQLKSRFLVNMSHEIRTPMNAIIGLSELQILKSEALPGYSALKRINESAKNLLTIINDILDFSKLEAHKFELVYSEFDIEELILEVMDAVSERLENKPVEFTYSIDAHVPERICTDRGRIRQMLYNIFDNAAKFTEKGFIDLDVSIVSRKRNGIELSFVLTDTGIGIGPEALERVLLPFEQMHIETHMKYGGTGLGLTIVKSIAQLMGGSLAISSELNVGTEVDVRIVAKKVKSFYNKASLNKAGLIGEAKPTVAVHKAKSLKNARVLVCEDVEINQEVALGILEIYEAVGSVACNGREALDILEKQEFDIILMDINMPEMDGYEATREIRRRGIKTPIIAMTGNTEHSDIALCLEAGMNAHIEKPISMKEFEERVSCWMPD